MRARAQLQVVFEEWVCTRGPWRGTVPVDPMLGEPVAADRLLERLRRCEDAMSPAACRALGLDREATYAEGVELLTSGGG